MLWWENFTTFIMEKCPRDVKFIPLKTFLFTDLELLMCIPQFQLSVWMGRFYSFVFFVEGTLYVSYRKF